MTKRFSVGPVAVILFLVAVTPARALADDKTVVKEPEKDKAMPRAKALGPLQRDAAIHALLVGLAANLATEVGAGEKVPMGAARRMEDILRRQKVMTTSESKVSKEVLARWGELAFPDLEDQVLLVLRSASEEERYVAAAAAFCVLQAGGLDQRYEPAFMNRVISGLKLDGARAQETAAKYVGLLRDEEPH